MQDESEDEILNEDLMLEMLKVNITHLTSYKKLRSQKKQAIFSDKTKSTIW